MLPIADDVKVTKFVKWASGEKYYRAVMYFGIHRGRMLRSKFKRARDARAWGERLAARLHRMEERRLRELEFQDADRDSYGEFESCPECGGTGFIVSCCDDLCVGAGECMHGDGEDPCPVCHGEGDV